MKFRYALALAGFLLGIISISAIEIGIDTISFFWTITSTISAIGFCIGLTIERRYLVRKVRAVEYWPIIFLILSLFIKGNSVLEDWATKFPISIGLGLAIGICVDRIKSKVKLSATFVLFAVILILGLYLYDIYLDRMTSIRITKNTPIFEKWDDMIAFNPPAPIGTVKTDEKAKVLRIRFGKDFRSFEIQTESGLRGWIRDRDGVEVVPEQQE